LFATNMGLFFSLIMKRMSIIYHHTTCLWLVGRCTSLCQHHVRLHVDWGKSQVLPPETHRSVQLLLPGEPPVYMQSTKHDRIYQKNLPCRNLHILF
jgi:hypothetical protein